MSEPFAKPIWDWLDVKGIEFRAPQCDLVNGRQTAKTLIHGNRPDCLYAPLSRLIPFASETLRFQISEGPDLQSFAPTLFHAAIREPAFEKALAQTVEVLTGALGPPKFSPAHPHPSPFYSVNNFHSWQFGRASANLSEHEYEAPKGLELNIRPAWIPSLPHDIGAALLPTEIIYESLILTNEIFGPSPFVYRADDFPMPESDALLWSQEAGFVWQADGLRKNLEVIPVELLTSVRHNVMRPAWGGGGEYAQLVYRPRGSGEDRCITVDSRPYQGSSSHDITDWPAITRLAELFDLTVTTRQSDDC